MKEVIVNMNRVKQYAALIDRELSTGSGRMRGVLTKWAFRWRSFQQERFVKYSRGGGDWKPLAESTKRARRKAGKGRTGDRVFTILWDKLGSLMKALTPAFVSAPGQYEKTIPYGISVGFGGPQRREDGPATIADIASYHHNGTNRIPRRMVIDSVSAQVKRGMSNDLLATCKKMLGEAK